MLVPRLQATGTGDGGVVPAHPAVHHRAELAQHPVAGQGDDTGVQLGVGHHQTVLVVRRQGGLAGRLQLPQPLDVRVGGRPGGQSRRLRLQQGADREQVVRLPVGRGVHEGALGRLEIHPALGLQALQRLAHRLPAHAELAGQLTLHQVLPRPQRPLDDQVGERLVHGLPQGCRTLQRLRDVRGAHRSGGAYARAAAADRLGVFGPGRFHCHVVHGVHPRTSPTAPVGLPACRPPFCANPQMCIQNTTHRAAHAGYRALPRPPPHRRPPPPHRRLHCGCRPLGSAPTEDVGRDAPAPRVRSCDRPRTAVRLHTLSQRSTDSKERGTT